MGINDINDINIEKLRRYTAKAKLTGDVRFDIKLKQNNDIEIRKII